MTHPERVEDYLEHIAQAIARATGYLQHTENLAAFEEAPLYQDAVLRNMEIIGEAATKIHKAAPDFTAASRNSVGENARDAQSAHSRIFLRESGNCLEHCQKRSATVS